MARLKKVNRPGPWRASKQRRARIKKSNTASKTSSMGPRYRQGQQNCGVCSNIADFFKSVDHEVELGDFDDVAFSKLCPNHTSLLRYYLCDPNWEPAEGQSYDPDGSERSGSKEEEEQSSDSDSSNSEDDEEEERPVRLLKTDSPPVMYQKPGAVPTCLLSAQDPQAQVIAVSSHLAILPTRGSASLPGHARLVDPSWIDLRLLKKWKKDCLDCHETCRERPLSKDLTAKKPLFVIDLWQNCIVSTPDSASYWALSYVWGAVNQLMTTKENLSQLCVPGSMKSPRFFPSIPDTIRHAMALTDLLGQRYLWVDALCIVQDDHQKKQAELDKMSAIYYNAELTVIAGNGGSSDHGLLGLRGISGPRKCQQQVFSLGKSGKLVECHWPWTTTLRRSSRQSTLSTWRSRGWTFQESYFSMRRIIFYDGYVGWECSRGCKAEYIDWDKLPDTKPASIIRYSGNELHLRDSHTQLLGPVPAINILGDFIEEFNDKDLTFPEDVLDAFAGLASVLGGQYPGGFISGLPSVFFNMALLWDGYHAQRRLPKKSGKHYCLPSWSWIGWMRRGPPPTWDSFVAPSQTGVSSAAVNLSNWTVFSVGQHISQALDEDDGPWGAWKNCITSPVQWRRHDKPADVGIPIQDRWSQYRERFLDSTIEETPEDWSRVLSEGLVKGQDYCCAGCLSGEPCTEVHLRSSADLAQIPRCFYAHKSDPLKLYLFPMPGHLPHEPYKFTYTRLISCTTYGARFDACERIEGRDGWVRLRDESGKFVGVLGLGERDDENSAKEHQLHGKTVVQLVEIANGRLSMGCSFPQPIFEIAERECPWNSGFYEYIWVLWIRWQNGIAYREGIGRVFRTAWERAEKERTELMLG